MTIFKIVNANGAEYVSGERTAAEFLASYWGGCDIVEVDEAEANEHGGAEDIYDLISRDDNMADAYANA